MKIKTASILSTALLLSLFAQSQQIKLSPFASGYDEPIGLEHAGDERLFVIEQKGVIQIIDTAGTKLPTPFLDIQSKVYDRGNEQGLLGLAFHPSYKENGLFYLNYTIPSRATIIAEYKVSDDPNVANASSERVLMTIAQPYSNHNGGCIEFGPDGYLYIGMGDGGFAGDPINAGQTPGEHLGKMLRIDVDGGDPYNVPKDNPFVDKEGYQPEIWAMGVRNPWRFAFDPFNGDMWIADVGQDKWEEISFQAGTSSGGENYGWRCREGAHDYRPGDCTDETVLTEPVYEFANNNANGCSVTGGHVYRGALQSDLFGKYIFTDYCSGNIWVTEKDGNDFKTSLLGQFVQNNYSSFGFDVSGETYLCERARGNIVKMTAEGNCQPIAHFNGYDGETTWIINQPLMAGKANGLTYEWALDGTALNETSNTIIPEKAGTYRCIVTNLRGCSDTAEITITALITSTQEIKELPKASLFPNPANDRLTIKIPADWPNIGQIEAVDLTGRTTYLSKTVGRQHQNVEIFVGNIPKGTYLLKFYANDFTWTQPFSINR